MATLVLSSIGSAVAGPAGGALGGFFGRQVDRQFRGSRSSRRVNDLRIQGSHYGAEVPAVYGRMRVAGTVVWASDLVEGTRAGKNGSQLSYSASFALAMSSRQLKSVGRIWADGRLIRGVAGDHKIPFRMRMTVGAEDQMVDPLIASAEGIDSTPAYRGLSLLVFEDFDLSSFGNRIPQISAEVTAEEGGLHASSLICKVLELEAPQGLEDDIIVEGLAIQGESVWEGLEPLLETFHITFCFSESDWQVNPAGVHHLLGQSVQGFADKRQTNLVGDSQRIPNRVSLRFFDPAMNFSTGEKAASHRGIGRSVRIEFPGAIGSDDAKALAHFHLARSRAERRECFLSVPVKQAKELALGDTIGLEGKEGPPMSIVALRYRRGSVEVTARHRTHQPAAGPSYSGRTRNEADEAFAPLELHLLELPPMMADATPRFSVAIAGGFNRASRVPLELRVGAYKQDLVAARSVCGRLLKPLGEAPGHLFDNLNVIEVQLSSDEWLISVADEDLLAGANRIVVGSEVLQFGTVEVLGGRSYRLHRLLRGRLDSPIPREHPAGTSVVVTHLGGVSECAVPADFIGSEASIQAQASSGHTISAACRFQGRYVRPWSPANLFHQWNEFGLRLAWTRRSRAGLPWLDYVDAPMGESQERYLIAIMDQSGGSLERQTDQEEATLSAAELAALGPRPWLVTLRQLGDFGASEAGHLTINQD